jgi:hypothetical protein
LSAKVNNIAEAGADYAIWKLNQAGNTYTGETGTSFGGGTYDVAVTTGSSTKTVTVTARVSSGVLPVTRKVRVVLSGTPSDQPAFNYAVQVGAGGLSLSGATQIYGSVYSNGNIVSANSSPAIHGDAWVAGSSGSTTCLTVTKTNSTASDGNVHAHSINGSYSCATSIARDAYYQTITTQGTTVSGTKHPGSSDPVPSTFAISAADISDWKAAATAGGTQTGNVTIGSGTTNLGPKKIVGNLTVNNIGTLNLTGAVYVTGTIAVDNSGIVKIDSSFGVNGGMLIADGTISTSGASVLKGSGNSKSHLMTISTATGTAMNIGNSTKDDILVAPNGTVTMSGAVGTVEIIAYDLDLLGSASLTFDQGLASDVFTTGPGGRWAVTAWQTIH